MNKPPVNHPTGKGWLQLSRSKAAVGEGAQWERAQAQPQATKNTGRNLLAAQEVREGEGGPEAWARDHPAAPGSQLGVGPLVTLSNAYPPLLNASLIFIFTYHLLFPKPCFCCFRCLLYILKNNPFPHLLNKLL